MASFPKEHTTLYFDALIRTQKKESVLAFIMATYYAKKNNIDDSSVKDDIYKRLEYAYGLFRDNVRGYDNGIGSYGGTDGQFSSQYTLGLEMGIWKNSKLDLNDLALKVATNEITITDYFDTVLLNYIQPVNGKIIHPLYQILKYIKNNNGISIQKSEISNALSLSNEEAPSESINALYNIIIGTSYFKDSNNTLTISDEYTVEELLSKCNTKYLGDDGYQKAKSELENDDEKYIEYLISYNQSELSEEELESEIELEDIIEDRKYEFKQWLINSGRFKDNSVRNYSYYINYIKKHGYTDYDLYKVDDISIIDNLIYKFNNNEDYIAWNKKNRYTPSNALMAYKDFLFEKFGNNNCNHYVISIKDYSTLHKLYFDKYGYMYWSEGQSRKYNVGDVMYLYFSEDNGQEITSIKKKAVVTEINVSAQRLAAEKYVENVGIEAPFSDGFFIKVKLIAETDSDKLLFKNLKEKFAFSVPQLGSSLIDNKELINYIESAFENGGIIDKKQRISGGYNMIYYGTPGCGKSHTVNVNYGKSNGFEENLVHRVTFHPEYSNSDFIGQILPKTENEQVKYEFQAGPFSIALLDAMRNPEKKVCLIIEEINRGNASAIFGDIFQLLDRDDLGNSIYKIDNEPIKKYLADNKIVTDKIYIPSNLWVIATMNTSDQNVFTLDTAFKRRWRMKRIANKFNMNNSYDQKLSKMYIPGSSYTWEQFVDSINKAILKNNPTGLNSEDKQLGVYFVTENELSFEPSSNDKESIEKFIEKVLLYIWDDVAKIDPTLWFSDTINSFDELVDEYFENNLRVFKELFKDQQQSESLENNEENS